MFNLIDDPWIPVAMLDGRLREVGLRELLADPHSIASIETGWAASRIAVTDLALAIIHRSLDLVDNDIDRCLSYFEPGTWAEQTGAYLDRHLGAFDLDRYGQVKGLRALGGGSKMEPVSFPPSRLLVDLSISPDKAMRPGWGRGPRDAGPLSDAEIALELATMLRCDLTKPSTAAVGSAWDMLDGGTKSKYPPAAREARVGTLIEPGDLAKRDFAGIGLGTFGRVMLSGRNLAETLLLNAPPSSREERDSDRAMWEWPGWDERADNRHLDGYAGPADWLTFQQRAVDLRFEDGRLVEVVVAPTNFRIDLGVSIDQKKPGPGGKHDPAFYRVARMLPAAVTPAKGDAPAKLRPWRLDVQRAWTGLAALAATSEQDAIQPPPNLAWAAEVVDEREDLEGAMISATAYGTEFGSNSTVHLVSASDSYAMRGWLASTAGIAARAEVGRLLDRAIAAIGQVAKLELACARAASSDPKLPSALAASASDRLASAAEAIFRRAVAAIEPGESQEDVRGRVVGPLAGAAEAAIDTIESAFEPAELEVGKVPAIIRKRRGTIMQTITGAKPETPDRQAGRSAAELEIMRAVGSKAAAMKRDTALRADAQALGVRAPEEAPEAILRLLPRWSQEVERTDDADLAALAALGLLGGISGGTEVPLGSTLVMAAARQVARRDGGGIERSVRALVSASGWRLALGQLESILGIVRSTLPGTRVDIASLAADLYLFRTDPRSARLRWAKQYANA